jgi:hypothetical protein
MMKNIQKTRVPKLAWDGGSICHTVVTSRASLQTFKYARLAHLHLYTGQRSIGWVWTIESPKQNYLTSILLERDVNIFLRADALAHIFVPYGWIATLLGSPGPIMLMLIEMLWNGLCAWAVYQFFHTFLKKRKNCLCRAHACLFCFWRIRDLAGTQLAMARHKHRLMATCILPAKLGGRASCIQF